MTFLTRPFFTFIFAVEPVWLPLLIVDLVALLLLIFAERLNPRTLIFWIAVVIVVPFVGFILYLAFGSNIYSRWLFGRKHERDVRFRDAEPPEDSDLSMPASMQRMGADVCTDGNKVDFHWNRTTLVPGMASDIRSAERRVFVMARRLPREFDEVYDALGEAASGGVDVRVMTSSLGFGRTRGLRAMRRAGVRTATFHNRLYSLLSIRPANRNMRTVVVVDGRIAYEGRGACIRAEGPAAERLERRFIADWSHATGEGIEPSPMPGPVQGGVPVQVVSGGPDEGDDRSPVFSVYSEIITSSRSTLYMAFPYLLPNDEIYATVKMAVASGVDVRVLLPRRGRHWYQSWNSLAASNPLMLIGAKVYFVDRMLGKCVMISDGRLCCVGSADFCSRPMYQDFNTCCVVRSQDVAARAEGDFLEELETAAECHPEEYRRRSFGDMVRIAVARMLMFFN